MPLAKKQKIDRESNAAYHTSQPLFDALRKATSNLSDQKNLLKIARDTVQALHVKLAINDGDAAQHQLYLNNIFAAWEGVIQSFHEVFHQVTLITAEDASQGRPAATLHKKYAAILDTISNAQRAAEGLRSFNKNDGGQCGQEGEDESHGKAEEESNSPPSLQSSKPATSMNAGLKRPLAEQESPEEGASDTRNQPNAPQISTDAQRKKSNKSDGRMRRKALRKALRKATAEAATIEQSQPDTVIDNQTSSKVEEAGDSFIPVVEFEDVNSEVEARLKAKLEKAAEKKSRRIEKKRKRESVESLAKNQEDEEMVKTESEPKFEQSPVDDNQAGKPKKKKAKKTHSKVEAATDDAAAKVGTHPFEREADVAKSAVKPSTKAAKRKTEVESVAVEAGAGKKRKTKHAGKNQLLKISVMGHVQPGSAGVWETPTMSSSA